MDLRLALLILGAAVVLLVFGISRYSDAIEKRLLKFRKRSASRSTAGTEGKTRGKARSSGRTRNAKQAPVFGASAPGEEQPGEVNEKEQYQDQLFDFESDPIAEHAQFNEDDERHVDEPDLENGADPESGSLQREIQHSIHEPEPETEAEIDSLATLADDQVHELLKPAGPFTNLRQIDYWIKLSPSLPVTQADILSKLTHWDSIEYPVQLHALTQEDPHWVNLTEAQGDTAIMDVVASYQLLSNGNAATITDLNTFDEQVSKLGQALNAEKLMMATPEQALDQSLKLAQFFADSCELLEVSICAPKGQAFMGKLVETSAKQQGLDFMNGEYVRQKRMASKNIILYRMINQDPRKFDRDMSSNAEIECVKFIMMPALSRTPGRDAKEMLDAVKAFASRVKGDIRIPGETDYHHDLLLKLRNRVSKLEKNTLAAGLEPGGIEISRIFS
jgi:FtsZ-interacting cell division protein ZipA